MNLPPNDRPECKTCPMWGGFGLELDFVNEPERMWPCHLSPPAFVGAPDSDDWTCMSGWAHPVTDCEDGCSHHPDFPAWVVARRAKESG
jgi:hypothetical protein